MTTVSAKEIPDHETLEAASKLEIYDVTGSKVAFESILRDKKVIVVFIRHFFCGACKLYVEQLAGVKKEDLEQANAKIVVIGCGEWNPIKTYAAESGFHGEIFADPSRQLYRTLGMSVENYDGTPAGQQRRSYLTQGALGIAMSSIAKGLKHPTLIGKQGNFGQLGGEFVFGPGLQCLFASRMQHTEDHVEVSELLKAAGVNIS